MAKYTLGALSTSLTALALTVNLFIRVLTSAISLKDLVLAIFRTLDSTLFWLSILLVLVSFVMSLLARREAEDVIDTALTYEEELIGRAQLVLVHTSRVLTYLSLLILLVTIVTGLMY